MSEVQSTTNGGAEAPVVAAAPKDGAAAHVSKFAKKQAQKGGGKKNHKKVDEKEDEPYVVIIKNAENDFSRIHTEALPVFLNLNPTKALGAAPGESVAPYKQSSNYVIKVRTETRSAEVCFYGEENSSLFKSLAPKNPPAASSSTAIGGAKNDGVKKVVKLTDDDDDDDDTPAAMGALSTVQDMVEIIRPRPYYQNPLAYTLETTSKVDATAKGGKRARAEEDAAEENGAEDDEYATVLGSLKLVEMSLGSKQDKLVSTQMQLNTDLPIKEVRRILKDVPGLVSVWYLHKGTITGGSGGRARHAADSAAPKADGEKDGDDEDADEEAVDKHAMMTAGAGSGSAVFRAVFNDEEALFSAKELLEQFEVSSGVRAMIKLSDGYQRKYDERRREEVPVEEEQY